MSTDEQATHGPNFSRRQALTGALAGMAGALLPSLASETAEAAPAPDYYYPKPESAGGWRRLVTINQTPSAAQQQQIQAKTGVIWSHLLRAYQYSRSFTPHTNVLVIRNGWIVGEWGSTSAFAVASCSKTLTGLTMARLFDLAPSGGSYAGITPEAPLYALLPGSWAGSDARKRQIKIRHVLTMTSGLAPDDRPQQPNYLSVMMSKPMKTAPAKEWFYVSLPIDLMGVGIQNVTRRSIQGHFNQLIAAPLGIPPIRWGSFSGYTNASSEAWMSARDLARVGYLMLKGGAWNNGSGQRQVVSRANLGLLAQVAPFTPATKFVPTPGSPFPILPQANQYFGHLKWTNRTGHGLGWGVPRDAYYARGYRETLLVVVPSRNLVVVRYGPLPLALREFKVNFMSHIMRGVLA